jgi:short-subunit dehydrogenase
MEHQKKYALVTGASSGIGWHISEVLAKRGYHIIAVSNRPDQLENLKSQLEQAYPVTVSLFQYDLAQEDAAAQVFAFCEKQQVDVEVLVNNAGMLIFGENMQVEYPQTKHILYLHMVTPVLLCRLFGEKMAKERKGFILNISSISAVMPYPGISLYGPTKAFLRFFTRAIRTELKYYGVKVTCLIPGATATALFEPYRINIPLLTTLGVFKPPFTVAQAGVKALFKGRAESIPGCLNKFIVWFFPFIPQALISLIYRKTNWVKKSAPY